MEEFVRRWCLHIQPEQLTKTRYLGGWSNQCRAAYMTHCLALLSQTQQPGEAASEESAAASSAIDAAAPQQVCSHCGSDRLLLVEETPRPSWRDLLGSTSESCPQWYAHLQREDDRRYWDGLMGEGFNAWYLETVVESAKETTPPPPPPAVQLYLPGLSPSREFQLESL